jgi:hypothetical protein
LTDELADGKDKPFAERLEELPGSDIAATWRIDASQAKSQNNVK